MNHRNLLLPTLLLGFCVAACAKAGGEAAADGNKVPATASTLAAASTPAANAAGDSTASATEKKPSSDDEDPGALPKTKGITQTFTACMERADTDSIAQADCLTDERDRQDKRLNQVYKALLAELKGSQREQMVEAQRAWVQLQQKDGAFEASIFDNLGQLGNLQGVENQMLRLAERANRLENYTELAKSQP